VPEPTSPATDAGAPLAGLILDWGGVLTAPLDDAMRAWAQRDRVDFEHFRDVLVSWTDPVAPSPGPAPDDRAAVQAAEDPVAVVEQVGGPVLSSASFTPVHQLERGEISPAQFERTLAGELGARGSQVRAEGLLDRMLGDLAELSDDMLGLVVRARRAGLRTALLSNSWGDHYPDALFQGLFDAVVISGRVGMRKPEERIFLLTAHELGLDPRQCVMVDDLPHNVHAAAAAGMVGVLHRSYEQTAEELQILFGVALSR
jgi:epoxide hydrolase-like predicted phosphatase